MGANRKSTGGSNTTPPPLPRPKWLKGRYQGSWQEYLLLLGTSHEPKTEEFKKFRDAYINQFEDTPVTSVSLSANPPSDLTLQEVVICQVHRNPGQLILDKRERFKELCTIHWADAGFPQGLLYYSENKETRVQAKIKRVLQRIPPKRIIPCKTLVVFPENVLPYACVPELLTFSKETGVILVGGMEHRTWGKIKEFFNTYEAQHKEKFACTEIRAYLDGEALEDTEYLNLTIIINGGQKFSFQQKHVPVYIRAKDDANPELLEGTHMFAELKYFKFETSAGPLAILICKDFLTVQGTIIDWMNSNNIPMVVIPAFSNRISPFIQRLSGMVDSPANNKLFGLASIAEYGGSGLYCRDTRDLLEPANFFKIPGREERIVMFQRVGNPIKWVIDLEFAMMELCRSRLEQQFADRKISSWLDEAYCHEEFLDRGASVKAFKSFLNQDARSAHLLFIIGGDAGTGKTWEIAYKIKQVLLSEDLLAFYVSGRTNLEQDLINIVKYEEKGAFLNAFDIHRAH